MEIEIKQGGKNPAKEITLPSGMKVQIFDGKAKHVNSARARARTIGAGKNTETQFDQEVFMMELMAQLCTFDGKAQPLEYINEMGMKDYMALLPEFSDFLV